MMWVLLAVVAWPFMVLWTRPVSWDVRIEATVGLLQALPVAAFVIVVGLTAPFVVPVALVFTRWEDNQLPWLFRPWDNDVSINGDRPEYWDPRYGGQTYYAKAHPRSFWARYVWLGWRNRASRLAVMLGYPYDIDEFADEETWGDRDTGRNHEGWVLHRRGPMWQLYWTKKVGKWCLRLNCGHKTLTAPDDPGKEAMVVFIPISVLGWTGA